VASTDSGSVVIPPDAVSLGDSDSLGDGAALLEEAAGEADDDVGDADVAVPPPEPHAASRRAAQHSAAARAVRGMGSSSVLGCRRSRGLGSGQKLRSIPPSTGTIVPDT
jgi:hypothetical protein